MGENWCIKKGRENVIMHFHHCVCGGTDFNKNKGMSVKCHVIFWDSHRRTYAKEQPWGGGMKGNKPAASNGVCLVFWLTISFTLFEIHHCCFFPPCIAFELSTIFNLLYFTELCEFGFILPLFQLLGRSFLHTWVVLPSSTVIVTNLPTITCFWFKLFFVNCLFIGKETCLKTIALACSAHNQNI